MALARRFEQRRPDAKAPNFDLSVEITETDLTKMNDLLQAYGDFDVTAASTGLADLDQVWTPDNGGDLVRLHKHVDGYEYEEAQVLVSRLLEQAGSRVS